MLRKTLFASLSRSFATATSESEWIECFFYYCGKFDKRRVGFVVLHWGGKEEVIDEARGKVKVAMPRHLFAD